MVAIVAVALIAAAAIPLVSSAEAEIDAVRVADLLESLDSSLRKNATDAAGNQGFCRYMGKCPAFLTNLVVYIVSGQPSCAANWTNGNVNAWDDLAPWSGLTIVPGSGLKTPYGTVHDTIVRLSGSSYELHLDSLSADQANYLDFAVDGVAGVAAGRIRYALTPNVLAATGQSLYLVRYVVSGTTNVNC